jgi:hypothetical protein
MQVPRKSGGLRFVGHTGEITNLRRLTPKTMFVVDSNLVLNLLSNHDKANKIPQPYFEFLLASRQRAHTGWKVRERFIPIDPVLAIMELTKQNSKADFPAYHAYFDDFFRKIYSLRGYDPTWVKHTYEPALRLVQSTQPSIQETVVKVFSLVPAPGKHSNKTILDACDEFLQWVLEEQDRLVMIGGPLLHAAIYAIAGSPVAQKLLKVERARRDDRNHVAGNVAWDFMYWIHLDMNYHFKRYDNSVVCTSDTALIDLLIQRQNMGPRFSANASYVLTDIPSVGALSPTPLARVDSTSLGDELIKRLLEFWKQLDANSTEHIKFGLSGFRSMNSESA